ncbi:MAG TPA: CNNM domain-containing protein [Kofleriaceae bacterium]|nr:CNNM domain-containing protein [Kofleriaceae bacterium]
MELLGLAVALVVLLALNAFFVLAEFAIVRVRPSQVAEMAAAGNARAAALAGIQQRMDEYLGVCQVGITLASVALGMVGKNATDAVLGHGEHDGLRYAIAIGLSYAVVSGSHIVLGEQVPKFIGIRVADRAALWSVAPLRVFHVLFRPALWLLTHLTNAILRAFGVRKSDGQQLSEEELRILLDQSQERGMMSFRRLIFFENVFDFGALQVKDAMRSHASVKTLDASRPWDENLKTVRESRYTRYPLVDKGRAMPVGLVHLKDLVIRDVGDAPDLRALARPILSIAEAATLESLLAEMQRRRIHAALVHDEHGAWSGFITLEDVIEELIGTIRDEFEEEEPIRLADALTVERIQLDVEGETVHAVVRSAMKRVPPASLPLPAEQVLRAVDARDRLVSTYLGHGIALPHARVSGLARPFLMVLRTRVGLTFEGTADRGHLLFVLLTPAGQPRVHQRLLSIIATLLHESEYVKDRLMTAETPEEVLEVIRTGEQAVLD